MGCLAVLITEFTAQPVGSTLGETSLVDTPTSPGNGLWRTYLLWRPVPGSRVRLTSTNSDVLLEDSPNDSVWA